MSAGDLGRLEIVLGIRNVVGEELAGSRPQIQQQVAQYAQGVSQSAAAQGSAAGGSTYNPVAGNAGAVGASRSPAATITPGSYNPLGAAGYNPVNGPPQPAQKITERQWIEQQYNQLGIVQGSRISAGQYQAIRDIEGGAGSAVAAANRAEQERFRQERSVYQQYQTRSGRVERSWEQADFAGFLSGERDQRQAARDAQGSMMRELGGARRGGAQRFQQEARDRAQLEAAASRANASEESAAQGSMMRELGGARAGAQRQQRMEEADLAGLQRGARRMNSAELDLELSQSRSHLGRSRILDREAEAAGGMQTVEGVQLMERSQREYNQSFFGPPRGRMMAMQLLFGAWEVSRAMHASTQMAGFGTTSSVNLIQTQQQALQQMQGGIYGSIAGAALGLGDVISHGAIALGEYISPQGGGAGYHHMTQGFGVLGRYSPTSAMIAQTGAITGLQNVSAKTAAYAQELNIRAATTAQLADAALIGKEDAGSAADRIMNTYQQGTTGLRNEQQVLHQRLADALTGNDETAKSQARADISVFYRTAPDRQRAIWETFNSSLQANERDLRIKVASITHTTLAGANDIRGIDDPVARANAQFGLTPIIGPRTGNVIAFGPYKAGTPEFTAAQGAYDVLVAQERQNSQRRLILEDGQAKSLSFQFQHQPLQARLAEITATYLAELPASNLPGINVWTQGGFSAYTKYLGATALATQQDVEEKETTQLALTSTQTQLRMSGRPRSARLEEIWNTNQQQSRQLELRGDVGGAAQLRSMEPWQELEQRKAWQNQDKLTEIDLRTRGKQLDVLLNPAMTNMAAARLSAGAIGQAGSDMAAIQAMSDAELPSNLQKMAGQNALRNQEFLRRDYLDSFRAVQTRNLGADIINPRDQEDTGEYMKQLNNNTEEIKTLLRNLGIEQ